MSEGFASRLKRVLLAGLVVLLVLLLGGAAYFLTRRVTPGEFVVRLTPAGQASRSFQLALRGPGGGVLGLWGFQGVPGPSVLAGLQEKVPWKAVSTNAGPSQPCVTLEVAPAVPEPVVAPVERLLVAQCCPGLAAPENCPVRRVLLGR